MLSVLPTIHLVQTENIFLPLHFGHRETVVFVQSGNFFFGVLTQNDITWERYVTSGLRHQLHRFVLLNFPLTLLCIQICISSVYFRAALVWLSLRVCQKPNDWSIFVRIIYLSLFIFIFSGGYWKILICIVRGSISGELMKRDRSCVSPIQCLAKPYPTYSLLLFYAIRPNSSRTSAADR